MWKAKITDVSNIDGAGVFETTYIILKDDVQVNSHFVIRVSSKEQATNLIKEKITELKKADEESLSIQVGEEITI